MPFPQWMRRSRSCIQSPPDYNLATSCQDIDIKAANPLITASDIPQWTWTKDQCIEWVTEILVEKCGHERADARRKAEVSMAEGGFGPTLYLRAATTWAKNLGKDDGHAIHALLLSYRHMKGAVPSGIEIYQKPKEVGYSPPKFKKGTEICGAGVSQTFAKETSTFGFSENGRGCGLLRVSLTPVVPIKALLNMR